MITYPVGLLSSKVDNSFKITIDTSLDTGDNFQLPLPSGETYNFVVNWGDGNEDTITVYNQAETLHNYSSGGVYQIAITGECGGWSFNNTGDKLKITSIDQWGDVSLVSIVGGFYGCLNLSGSLPELPTSITNVGGNAFRDCSGLTGTLTLHSGITVLGSNAFRGCSGFTGDLLIPSTITTLQDRVYQDCSGFTGNLAVPTSITTILTATFFNCSSLTGTLTLHSGITAINSFAFASCSGLTRVDSYPLAAPTVGGSGLALGGTARPLHIQTSGTSGYDVNPWTDTGIFSSIIQDL